jgi:signal transduction histidine kinase
VTLDVLWENYDLFDDAKKRDYLKRGLDVIARQQRLIEAMKSYSLFDVKDRRPLDYGRFWDEFVERARHRTKRRNIRFSSHRAKGDWLVKANKVALNRAVTNILENAMEAVEKREGPEISLRTWSEKGFVHIVTKDNGIGIEDAHLTKVFIPLYTTKKGKAGMGLPIARKLLLKMDGEIALSSVPSDGTEVLIRLRLAGRPAERREVTQSFGEEEER